MARISGELFATWCAGEWHRGKAVDFCSVGIDTRRIEEGQLFAALRTERRDGHEFLAAAQAAGACGALVDRIDDALDFPQLRVADVGAALLQAAQQFRASWNYPVVGVTGSCGKTTCKDLLAAILAEGQALGTQGNLNNLLGVPLSILRGEALESTAAVLEAGISEPGEMQQLAACIAPDFGVLTAVGAAHLEGLGSLEGVAREKLELFRRPGLRRLFVGETCIPFLDKMTGLSVVSVVPDASLSTEGMYAAGRGELKIRCANGVEAFTFATNGGALAQNAALAISCALTMGCSHAEVQRGLGRWKPSALRAQWLEGGGMKVFLDCYNANPLSMGDALRQFAAQSPAHEPRIYVIGCMEELGTESERYHRELGAGVPLRAGDRLIAIGGHAEAIVEGAREQGVADARIARLHDAAEVVALLEGFKGSLFLKGSRRYRLERCIEGIDMEECLGGAAC